MPLLSRIVTSRAVRRIVVVVVVVAGYQVWLSVQAVGKVSPDIGHVRDARGRFPADVVIGFPPERYHILELQKHGRIAGTDGNIVHLRGVSPAGVDALARQYWIERVEPPGGE